MHAHTHKHRHSHEEHPQAHGKRLLLVICLNICITVAQTAGGLLSGSLALLSDALHNASDVIAVIVSWFASMLAGKNASETATYGYKRAEILAALLNAVVLVAISLFLFAEAAKHLYTTNQIDSKLMMGIAAIGLIGNTLSAWLLHAGAEKSLNLRSSYLHMLTDGLTSLAVIVGGAVIRYTGFTWIDALLTFIIGLYVLKGAGAIIYETVNILMQGAPGEPEPAEISQLIEARYPIATLHHMHLWMLNDREIHFDCHMKLTDDILISEADVIRNDVALLVQNKFTIIHTTIQIEFQACTNESLIKQSIPYSEEPDYETD